MKTRVPIPVMLCVDVELDPLHMERRSTEPWRGYEAAHAWLSEIRPSLQDATGMPVRYSWLLRIDAQITDVYGRAAWVVDRYGTLLEEAMRVGDEIGLHPHFHRWDPRTQDWLLDLTDQAWIDDCVLEALDAFPLRSAAPVRQRTSARGSTRISSS